jgi:type IV pilus assembly protein PilV
MPQAKKPSQSQGFSLIEVLISMLILAFGVLSMGGLQLASLRSSQSAANFSAAVTLAKDYTEMMRSNSTVSNNTSTVAGVNPYLFDSADAFTFTTTPSVDCKTTLCTGAQLSVLHIADWAGRITSQLPGGRAVVCRDPAPRNANGSYRWSCGTNAGTAVTVKLGWIDKRDKEERGTTTVSITPLAPQLVMGGVTGFAE